MTKDFQDDPTYPYGIAVANSIVNTDIKFIGGEYLNSYRQVFNCQHIVRLEIVDTKQRGRGAMITRGRFIDVHDNDIELTPDWTAPVYRPYIWAVDTGTSDAKFHNNVCRSSDTALVHIHEGLGNIKVFDNEFYLPETASVSAELLATVSITGQSWNTSILNNTFYNTPDNYTIRAFQNTIYSTGHRNIDISGNKIFGTVTAGSGPGTAIRTDVSCNGTVHGNIISATLGGFSIDVDNGDVTVRNNDVPDGSSSLSTLLTPGDVTGNKGIHLSEVYMSSSDFSALSGSVAMAAFATSRATCWAFDATSNESISSTLSVPDQAASAVVTLISTNLGAGTGVVKWNLNYSGFIGGEDMDVADSTATLTWGGAVGQDYMVSSDFASFSVTDGDMLKLSIERDASDGADTLGNDAGVISIKVRFSL
jgi:hypothetical protein